MRINAAGAPTHDTEVRALLNLAGEPGNGLRVAGAHCRRPVHIAPVCGASLHIESALHYGGIREVIVAAIGLAVPWGAKTIELGLDALSEYEQTLS